MGLFDHDINGGLGSLEYRGEQGFWAGAYLMSSDHADILGAVSHSEHRTVCLSQFIIVQECAVDRLWWIGGAKRWKTERTGIEVECSQRTSALEDLAAARSPPFWLAMLAQRCIQQLAEYRQGASLRVPDTRRRSPL